MKIDTQQSDANNSMWGRSDVQSAWITPFISGKPWISRTSQSNKSLANKHLSPRETKSYRVIMRNDDDISTNTSSLQTNHYWDGTEMNADELIESVRFNDNGLVPAIAQQWDTNEVLMMAWMNAESIRQTVKSGRAIYYSRSRKQLWRKGDTSGQIQQVRDIILDCDGDTILLLVDQLGVACHTGRRSCFYTSFRPPYGKPEIIADVLMDPSELYKSK